MKLISVKLSPQTNSDQCTHGLRTLRDEIVFKHGQKFNPNPKFFSTAEAYFVCHISPIFQIFLIYAFIGCPQSVAAGKQATHANATPAPSSSLFVCICVAITVRYVQKLASSCFAFSLQLNVCSMLSVTHPG